MFFIRKFGAVSIEYQEVLVLFYVQKWTQILLLRMMLSKIEHLISIWIMFFFSVTSKELLPSPPP